MERYVKGEVCGRGADGTVKMATLTEAGRHYHQQRLAATGKRCREDFGNLTVAIKKIRAVCFRNPQAGLKVEALREVKILKHLSLDNEGGAGRPHAHVVSLLDVFIHKQHSLKLVFNYLPIHLQHVLDSRRCQLTPDMIKGFAAQLLRGIAYLHSQQVLHRDIKPNNLLIGHDGVLQIADFGRAKFVPAAFDTADEQSPPPVAAAGEDGEAAAFRGGGQNGSYKGDYTCQVVLLQFRAPELLVGARRYGGGVDVWAAGGVLAEMILRPAPGEAPSGFFTSDQPNAPMCGDATQLRRMLDILGVPEDRYATALADMGELPEIVPHMIPASRPPTFPLFFQNRPNATEGCVELLTAMFSFSPRQRCDASAALSHSYFALAEPKALSATSLAVELEPLLRRGSSESASDDEAAGGAEGGGGDFSGLRRGPLFNFGSGDSGASGGSHASGQGVLRRQALFGSDESGSGYGGGGGSGEGWRSGGSGSNMGMDSVSAPVGAGGRLGGGGGGGLFGSGATRALFDSDDSDDPDL